jgi:hypothetical protein
MLAKVTKDWDKNANRQVRESVRVRTEIRLWYFRYIQGMWRHVIAR